MKAIIAEGTYKAAEFEASKLVVKTDFPIPEPQEGELLVKIHAASLNPVDYKVPSFPSTKFPIVLGYDGAGVVFKVGANVSGFKVGDRVYYHGNVRQTYGCFAEYATINHLTVSHLPEGVSYEDAASLPTAGWTAYTALHDKARVRPGETILITAGAGGVGGFAIQLAKLAGLTVITTCSSKNIDHVKKLGADHVIDYTKEDIVARTKEITNGRGVDFWLDMVSPESANMGMNSIAFGGAVIVIQSNPTIPIGDMFSRQPSIHDIFLGGHHGADIKSQKHLSDIGDAMIKLVKEKKLDTLISEVISLDKVPEALERIKHRHVTGKIVVKVA